MLTVKQEPVVTAAYDEHDNAGPASHADDGEMVQDPPPTPPWVPGQLYDDATLAAFERMSRIAHVAIPLPLPPTSGPPPVRMQAFFLGTSAPREVVLPENAHVECPKPPSAAPGRTTMRALVRPPAPSEAAVPTLAEFNKRKPKLHRKDNDKDREKEKSVPRVHHRKRKAWTKARGGGASAGGGGGGGSSSEGRAGRVGERLAGSMRPPHGAQPRAMR